MLSVNHCVYFISNKSIYDPIAVFFTESGYLIGFVFGIIGMVLALEDRLVSHLYHKVILVPLFVTTPLIFLGLIQVACALIVLKRVVG